MYPLLSNSSKFIGEQDERHCGELQWPGIFGFPVRSKVLRNLKSGEEYRARVVGDFHCRVFDLNDLETRAQYEWVRDRAVNGWFAILKQDYKTSEHGPYPCVYLEWIQLYCEWSDEQIK